MKVIKPQRLGILTKVFEHDDRQYMAVAVLLYFPFESPGTLLPEMNLWKFAAAELGKDAALDMGMPKPRGELLVTGRGYTLGRKPRPACSVRVKIGAIDKTLYVVGDRVWKRGSSTDPEFFTEMPITYERAFGGAGYALNPVGKGFAPIRNEAGEVHLLPNIEDPAHLVRSPKDRPAPVGFGAYDIMWPQRFSKAGTYDDTWLKDRYPGFPADTDLGIFNIAPEDQQIAGRFEVDAAFSIENMHPDKPLLESRLPGVTPRCFITQKTEGGDVFREIDTHLETVHLFPHAERGILLFRGLTRVTDDDGADVRHIVAGCERAGEPKPAEHYEAVLKQRLDKEKGYLFMLRDSDLMPAPDPSARPVAAERTEITEMGELLATEGLLEKNVRRRAEVELEKTREHIKALGLDPGPYVQAALPPEPEPVPDLEDLALYVEQAEAMAEKQKAEAEAKRAEAEREARKACQENGLDYDKIMAEETKKLGGPPTFKAKERLAHLEDLAELCRNAGVELPEVMAELEDPEIERKLVATEKRLREVYIKFAHHFPEASRLEGEPAIRLREEVIASRAGGESFAERDFTGADLSGLDLRGADFRGAFLERADFTGSDLRGADFTGAVLARAVLSGADLTGAKLAGVNLGAARLDRARVGGGVDLAGAVLARADLSGADFSGARMEGADLMEAVLVGADFSGVIATNMNFLYSDLSAMKLSGANLTKCNFVELSVKGVDFSDADLTSSVFVTVNGDGAVFRRAKLGNLRVVMNCSFAGADFREALMDGANLRATNLTGSDFSLARMNGADLSECNLQGANFYRAVAVDSRFVKSDLAGASLSSVNMMHAILQRSGLEGANFEGANLFRADLLKVRVDGGTSMKGANLTQIRYVDPRRPHGQE